MRTPEEQRVALGCLELARGNIHAAERYYAFVTGKDVDDAKAKLDAIRKELGLSIVGVMPADCFGQF